MNDIYEKLSGRRLKAARFDITEDLLKAGGREFSYSYVNIKPGVCVIVKTADGFVVQREYRYPIKEWSYEFTAGVIEEGETPEQTAAREVCEETGYTVRRLVPLGEFYPSFGATDEVIHLFYAECGGAGENSLEFTEAITNELKTETEVEQLIVSGVFRHGAGLAAWLKYKLAFAE